MDPLTYGVSQAVSIGFQAYGAYETSKAAGRANAAQKQMIMYEQAQENLRRTQAGLNNRRAQMEVLRNSQRKRSIALANTSAQGAQFGSGLQGGYGQIAGGTNNNFLSLQQNYELGEKNFDINAMMSNSKIEYANAQRDMQTGQAWSSLGKSIGGASTGMANLATNFQSTPGSQWQSSSQNGGDMGYW